MQTTTASRETGRTIQQYDVVVIGAGSGCLTAAVGFRKVGKRVLLVEREHIGGECTNSGCIPSKALLHHAKEFHTAALVAGSSSKGEIFRTSAFTYVRNKIDEILAEETPAAFEKLGIDIVMGEARFVSKCAIEVAGTQYSYKTAVIATGSSPRLLEVPGLQVADVLTNQNIFLLKSIPAKTLIIGAGPIGLEMGQTLALLGSEVTIATNGEIGTHEDTAIRPLLQTALEKSGVTFMTNAKLVRVTNKLATLTRQLLTGRHKPMKFILIKS